MTTCYPSSIREEELKNKVAADFFGAFDCTRIIGNVDFCAAVPATDLPLCDAESVLWAEAKRGVDAPLDFALVQLILTIGKERTFDRHLPPKYLAAFNAAVTSRLNVLLMNDHYRQTAGTNALGFQLFTEISFSDGQKAHRIWQGADESHLQRRHLQHSSCEPPFRAQGPRRANCPEGVRVRLLEKMRNEERT